MNFFHKPIFQMRTTSRTKSHIIVEADEAVSGISVPLVAGGSDEVNVACSPSMSDKSSPSSSAEAVQSECSISTFDKTSPNRARIARTTPSMKGTPKKSARKRKGQLAAGESPSKKKGGMDLNSLFEDLEEEAKKVMVLDTIAEVWEYLEESHLQAFHFHFLLHSLKLRDRSRFFLLLVRL